VTRRSIRVAGLGVVVIGLGAVPLLSGGSLSTLQEFEYTYSLILVAFGLNIVTGYAGQLSLGPGAIFAVAGYTAAVLANHWPNQVGLTAMCAAGILSAVAIGFVIGIPALRVGGFYLAMTTLFFALLIPIVAGNWSVTGGADGISLLGNANFVQHVSGDALYETTLGVVFATIVASWLLLTCRVGRRFVTLQSSEELAASLGISGYRTKLLSFVLSAVPAGVGGALYAYTQQFMAPGSVTTNTSIYLLAACVIGGLGTVLGPLLGGLVVIGLSQFLGGAKQYEGIIFGLLLIAFSVMLPEGIMSLGSGPAWARRLASRRLQVLRAVLVNARPRGWSLTEQPAPHLTATSGSPPHASGVVLRAPEGRTEAETVDDRLEVRQAKRAFGGVTAVDGVSLTVTAGSIHALVGSNGSGKTTLLNLVSGYHRLQAGAVFLGSQRVDGHGPDRLARLGIARTFQTPKLVVPGSLLLNVLPAAEKMVAGNGLTSFLRTPAGRRRDAAARTWALSCLDAVGLTGRAEEEANELPHGGRRLIELARALALAPRFLLLDEPAAGLGPRELDVLRDVVHSAAAQGVGVLIVEHNIPLVLELADVITVLHMGRVLAQGPPSLVREDPEVAKAFLGRHPGASTAQSH
jgi:branched-chain amino acid transport system permease protein